jgi:hypothetical protein
MKEVKSSDAVTMGNGQSESALQIGDIPGQLCDKYGTIKNPARITDVLHMPTAQYNLFSIMKLQQNGWTLSGE